MTRQTYHHKLPRRSLELTKVFHYQVFEPAVNVPILSYRDNTDCSVVGDIPGLCCRMGRPTN